MSETLFISDLHLEAKRRPMTDLFLRFLRERARGADALYILGDLFEFWIGDDGAEAHDREIQCALKALVESGVPVFFLAGNRDFLLGEGCATVSGLRLIPDPTRRDVYGTPTLLMHGDSLCTDDAEYMAFRHLARSALWRDDYLSQSVATRRAIIRDVRARSEARKQRTPRALMDVNAAAVSATYRTAKVRCLIHGHTHREALHETTVDGAVCRRYVLGDWTETRGSVLRATPKAWTLEAFA